MSPGPHNASASPVMRRPSQLMSSSGSQRASMGPNPFSCPATCGGDDMHRASHSSEEMQEFLKNFSFSRRMFVHLTLNWVHSPKQQFLEIVFCFHTGDRSHISHIRLLHHWCERNQMSGAAAHVCWWNLRFGLSYLRLRACKYYHRSKGWLWQEIALNFCSCRRFWCC